MKRVSSIPHDWIPVQRVMPAGKPGSFPFKAQSEPLRYCKRCGRSLLYCVTNEDGTTNYTLQEELSLGVCHQCYPAEIQAIKEEMARIALLEEEPTPEEKKAADTKYEEAIQRLMEEAKNRNGNNT